MPTTAIYLLFLTMFLGYSCRKNDSKPEPVPPFEDLYSITSRYRAHTQDLIIDVSLAPGLHAYGAGETIGKPVSLAVKNTNGWRPVGIPLVPAGHSKHLSGLGSSIVIDTPFTVSQKLLPGTGPGEAELQLQVCTNKACDRPRTHLVYWTK